MIIITWKTISLSVSLHLPVKVSHGNEICTLELPGLRACRTNDDSPREAVVKFLSTLPFTTGNTLTQHRIASWADF
jgi:hypothetical protein